MSTVLFLLKRNSVYSDYSLNRSTGLLTSAEQVVNMLRSSGIDAALEIVVDGNDVDRAITQLEPEVVVMEAIWCPPDKVKENQKLHPEVHWVVRIHSEIPFLANEGIAIDWLKKYDALGVKVTANSTRATDDLASFIHTAETLPNYYTSERAERLLKPEHDLLRIGCFGAVRPMKNQLLQAMAAIDYSLRKRKRLEFHVNGSRVEQGGEQVIKNLRALFAGVPGCKLIEHPWMPHEQFLQVVASMDLCMQVSMSETFNIVTADAVVQGVPVVVSPEVSWIECESQADPTSIRSITRTMTLVMDLKWVFTRANTRSLHRYNHDSRTTWVEFLERIEKSKATLIL